MPFKALNDEEDQMDQAIAEYGEVKRPTKEQSGATAHPLQNFHKKVNNALFEKLIIERERDRLRSENAELMSLLKQVQEGLVVNDEVLAKSNPLLLVSKFDLPVRHDFHPEQDSEGTEAFAFEGGLNREGPASAAAARQAH